jgi:purine-binding chemotaxis protein CheW
VDRLADRHQDSQVIVFRLGADEYGVDIASVEEIIRVPSISKVPKAPSYVEGVINLRGRIVPVIDLCERLDLAPRQQTSQSRIVVADLGEHAVGMIVDDVSEVLLVKASDIEPAPAITATIDSGCIAGIARLKERLVILMKLESVLATAELAIVNAAAEAA